MRLNRNTIIVLVAALLVIVVALVMLNQPEDTGPETVADDAGGVLFTEAAPETVTSLNVTDSTGLNVSLQRGDTDEALWQFPGNDDEVDAATVDTAVSTLTNLSYTDSYQTEDATQYGFGTEAAPAVITFVADGTEYTLTVGRQNPSGNRYYVRVGDDETIYLVNSTTLDTILGLASNQPIVVPPTPTPVPMLNAPGVVFVGFSAQDIQRFQVTDHASGESLVLVRGEDNLWTVLDDDRALDQSTVEVLMSVYGFVEAVDAIDGADLEALGLAEPAYTIQATDSSERTFKIQLGDTDASGTRMYALVDDYDTVAVIEADALSTIIGWLEEPPYAPEPTATVGASEEVTEEPTADVTEAATEEMTEEATEEADS
ncbi:DUF4340 domain-containing protein [Phototrophicus methaneseepsis]|uniref:DUF4340 domain-containing protein n=1 Tax=Phototrophicus methaneseepsis TaxID=2710758 RepID=A0A7S8EAN6_9CHLR|nr:DUF4340 domain-containing protein [Phototrophicus methaneseepsis]QPC83465.1 DUF4340 domain-containing protein [Phototrophicus methaneseepsis]